MSIHRSRIAVVVASALLATSCGAADEPAATTAPAIPSTVEVTTHDYAFTGLPAAVPVGTTFAVTNTSEAELHELVAIRLPNDETRTVAEIVANPADLVALFPSVSTVLIAPPGETGFAVEGTGVLAEPGRYAIICAIPTGADPAEYLAAAAESEGPPQVAGGAPHFAEGMYAEIIVES